MSGLQAFKGHIKHLESVVDNESIPWKKLVLQLLVAVYVFETYVSIRQYQLYSRPAPPAELASHVDHETYKNSAAYGKDKAKYSFVKQAADMAMMISIIHYDVYAKVWTYAGYTLARTIPKYSSSEVCHTFCCYSRTTSQLTTASFRPFTRSCGR